MLYLLLKGVISGVLVVAASEIARRAPSYGGLIASLPLVGLLALVWLWRDTGDRARVADLAGSTFWFVLPSLPMFLLIPATLRAGAPFWLSLAAGAGLTMALYALTAWLLARYGTPL